MNLLKLDYDGAFPRQWQERLGFVLRKFGLRVKWTRIDRTRHGWHVMVQLSRSVEPLELVLLQALCGSDYRRETFNGVRALALDGVPDFWRERFNQLFTAHHRSVTL